MFGSSSDLNHMPIFSGRNSGTTGTGKELHDQRHVAKQFDIAGANAERKRLGTVRKMPNSEPTRKAMIRAEMERATVI